MTSVPQTVQRPALNRPFYGCCYTWRVKDYHTTDEAQFPAGRNPCQRLRFFVVFFELILQKGDRMHGK